MRLVSLVCCLLLPSCATIIASGPDLVPVNSDPQGAKVSLDGMPVGHTPLVVPFSRTCNGVLHLELDGYEPATYDLDKVVNGWIFANLFWPVIGCIVDFATSNQGKYSTTPIYIELQAKPKPGN